MRARPQNATLRTNHPIFNFFRRRSLDKLSFDELKRRVETQGLDDLTGGEASPADAKQAHRASAGSYTGGSGLSVINDADSSVPLDYVVLKFTTLSEGNENSSFLLDGADVFGVGQGSGSAVCVPTDRTLSEENHAIIERSGKEFFLVDVGNPHGAAIRIEAGGGLRDWRLSEGAVFSAGNSTFRVCHEGGGEILVEITSGALEGERRRIHEGGASLGRATDNVLSIADRELSRRHSRIEYDASKDGFFLCDLNSTNGTYVHLVGPYLGKWRLCVGSQILVGRTGFSVNRFDYGVSDEIGRRATMEDANVVIQNLEVPEFDAAGLGPASFFGVYDGHGGDECSNFLKERLAQAVAERLRAQARAVVRCHREDRGEAGASRGGAQQPGGAAANGAAHNGRGHGSRSGSIVTDIAEFLASLAGTSTSYSTQDLEDAQEAEEEEEEEEEIEDVAAPHETPSDTEEGRCDHRLWGALDQRVCRLLTDAFESVDAEISALEEGGRSMSGSTAVTALLLRDRLWLANSGDSRAVLSRGGRVHAFTLDHKPDRPDEKRRIREAGGFVVHRRVLGELAVSRAFGDVEYKKGIENYLNPEDLGRMGGVFGAGAEEGGAEDDVGEPDLSRPILTAEPEIQSLALTEEDDFLLLACDGLFDVFSNEEAVQAVHEEMRSHQDVQRTVEALSRMAIHERHCRDNVTIVLIVLRRRFWEDR